jgi:hypothetical protein
VHLDFSNKFKQIDEFSRPDWEAIGEWIETNLEESERMGAWGMAARQWVDRLAAECGRGYRVFETANFLIVTAAPDETAADACQSFEGILKQLVQGLQMGVPRWKQVVLMFADVDLYYRYICFFYPDGEHPANGGICLSGGGYLHLAFPTVEYARYRSVLAHELTHALLVELPIPTWLDEAVAMQMEDTVCFTARFRLDRELLDQHLAHWDAETIQQFWSGESWQIPGDGFELSYNLAEVIWRKIQGEIAKSREQLLRFINEATKDDAGEAACLEIFQMGLGEVVADFLGPGEWKPNPDLMWEEPPPTTETMIF